MSRLVYDLKAIQLINLFETLTGARLKDCINRDNRVVFVVQQGEIAKAIGSKGINVKNLERSLKKKVKIAEYSDDCKTFIKNFIYPLKLRGIEEKDGVYTLKPEDSKTRSLLIGKVGVNLKELKEIVKRYFKIENMIVP